MDKTVKRIVEHEKYECLDCSARATMRAMFHKDERHRGKSEDCEHCDKYAIWVSSYAPK